MPHHLYFLLLLLPSIVFPYLSTILCNSFNICLPKSSIPLFPSIDYPLEHSINVPQLSLLVFPHSAAHQVQYLGRQLFDNMIHGIT